MGDWVDYDADCQNKNIPEPVNLDELHEKNDGDIDRANLEADSSRSDDEIPKGKELMNKCFNKWDDDASGLLDVDEILAGVEKFAEAAGLDFDSRRVASLFEKLDEDGNQELDREEFTIFLKKYADLNSIGMEDLASIMSSLEESSTESTNGQSSRTSTGLWFSKVFSGIVFQGQQQSKVSVSKIEKEVDKPPARLSNFFRLISLTPSVKHMENECDTEEDSSDIDPRPMHEIPADDIGSMMWDVDTKVNDDFDQDDF